MELYQTVGALDGKHIVIKCPKKGGSLYFSYKGFHYNVLIALVDANHKFIRFDTGENGSASDAAIFNHSKPKEALGMVSKVLLQQTHSRMTTDLCLII